MSKARVFFSCLAARTVKGGLHLLHRGGTSLPGKTALKLYPGLLYELGRDIDTVLITGTNGKSTTTGMVCHMLDACGMEYFCNTSGANMIQGIAAEYVLNASVTGRPGKHLAIMETDEANLPIAAAALHPRAILVTNLFADQLDRYGSLDNVREYIKKGILAAPDAVVCLNADEPLSASIGSEIPNRVIYYGTELTGKRPGKEPEGFTCRKCGTPLVWSRRAYAHLGEWACPVCGEKRPLPEMRVLNGMAHPDGGSAVLLDTPDGEVAYHLTLPAAYNIYNSAGALSLMRALGQDVTTAAASMAGFGAVFGRMETLEIAGNSVTIILIKNAAGCDQALDFLSEAAEDSHVIFCINNNAGDGTDASWIYDADFEGLVKARDFHSYGVYGMKADYMKQRLEDAGVPSEKIETYADLDGLAEAVRAAGRRVYVFPNYTCMLPVRDRLAALAGGAHYWEK